MSDRSADRAGGEVLAAAAVRPAEVALLASVFIVAACGLVYELAAGTLASYLLGDSILQFSTVIGAYLFAMGIGSWLSRFFERQLVAHFLRIELLVGLIGGLMPTALFAMQGAATASFQIVKMNFSGAAPGIEISDSSPSQVLQIQPFLDSFCTHPARSPVEKLQLSAAQKYSVAIAASAARTRVRRTNIGQASA